MAAGTMRIPARGMARRAKRRRQPVHGGRSALEAARLVVISALATLGLIGLTGIAAALAAAAPVPVGGPVPGLP